MSTLRVITLLGERLPREIARQAAVQYELRSLSKKRFPTMLLSYLTKKGLSQASSEVVAKWRARRFVKAADGSVVGDLTCGLGADSLALSLRGLGTVSSDIDVEHLQFARANLAHHGQGGAFLVADAGQPAAHSDLCLIDPDRRSEGRRQLDPGLWSPTLNRALEVAAAHDGACLKLSPTLDSERLEQAEASCLPSKLPRRREWLSRQGELVEICLWTGALASSEARDRFATRIDAEGNEVTLHGVPQPIKALSKEEAEAVLWIGDPDPAVLRAGLLGNLAKSLGLAPLASQIAYLGGQNLPESPFLRIWRVIDSSTIDRKKVRSMLRKHDIGPISVRKRGHPESPETLERKLRGGGKRRGNLLIARLETGHRAFLVEAAPVPALPPDQQ